MLFVAITYHFLRYALYIRSYIQNQTADLIFYEILNKGQHPVLPFVGNAS